MEHAHTDICIHSDCRGAVTIVQRILEGQGYDLKHEDADILHYIQQLSYSHNTNKHNGVIIRWVPAHLDDDTNHKKRTKYLNHGGMQHHIDGNSQADILAKKGSW